MKSKLLSATLTLSILAGSMGTALAEQPKAEEYKQIFSSGTYFVEYELNRSTRKSLEVRDGKRMDYTSYITSGTSMLGGLALINPFLAVAGLFGKSVKKEPTSLYQDGKYYQFTGKKMAKMATYDQLEDENLDPSEGWSSVRLRLSLPEQFVVFAPKDEFNCFTNYQIPTFVESGTVTKGKNELPFDKYTSPVKGKTGKVLAEKFFYMYYDKDGNLKRIKTTYKEPGKDEVTAGEIKVRKITGELSESALQIPKGCKVYAAGIGDMNDLLDKEVLVEDYSVKETDAEGSGKETKDAK